MEPRNLKKLAPAPASSSSGETPPQISMSVPGPRRNLTRNAKCDGNRPTCGRCQKASDTCLYEVNKRDIGRLQLLSDYDAAKLQNFEVVFGVLQNGTDYQATELFSQIRLGDSIETLASTLNPSVSRPSGSLPSEQAAFASNSDSAAMHSGSEDPSMAAESQSFMDLLLDRDGRSQPTDDIDHESQIIQDGIHPYVPDSTQPDGQ
ncbi:hypothetical protein Daesc_002928 [Daldinia eschscholtzii]|uniref:Zn(2)-C6 fungal-type domain-containing protein n=1 Tax=Daldinia eschscholtzii TaxID=292717 RepID=A0AAX6MRQ1_9PEZI